MTGGSESTSHGNTSPRWSQGRKTEMAPEQKDSDSDDNERVKDQDGDDAFSPSSVSAGKLKLGRVKVKVKDVDKAKPRQRQMLLSFSNNGNLSIQEPLRNPMSRDDAARKPLEEIARETKALLPGLLATRSDVPAKGYLYKDGDAPLLDMKYCPRLGGTRIRVINCDSIDAALALTSSAPNNRHPCVLNMANANSAGGGWEHGALAQEEALCYRTSLSKTLKKHYYPLPHKGGIYSPFLLVIRNNLRSGHHLLDLSSPATLPVISAVSVAAVCRPPTTTDANGVQKYTSGHDRTLMEEKMRVILRMAVKNGHKQIVLGAFGCGAFANPRQEVAKMWAAVLKEAEFAGGWWTDVVFAVLDDGKGNLLTFQKELDGLLV